MSREDDIKGIIDKPVSHVESTFNITVVVDTNTLDACFYRVDLVLEQSYTDDELSVFKSAGAICFWIRKLKPFSVKDDGNGYINEILAIMIAYNLLSGYLKNKETKAPKLTKAYMNDFIQSLRYNSHSPHSLVLLFEGLCLK